MFKRHPLKTVTLKHPLRVAIFSSLTLSSFFCKLLKSLFFKLHCKNYYAICKYCIYYTNKYVL